MDRISVEKRDEVYLRVRAEAHLLHELSDYFTFEVPGARFSPQYKSRMWDGKIRLFNMFSGELYLGLASYIKDFCRQRGYEFSSTIPRVGDDITPEAWAEFVYGLESTTNGEALEPRDYQLEAGFLGVRNARTLLLSPTASGKSFILYTMARWHQQQGRRQLIVVPTTSLVEQLASDFADYSSQSDWDADAHIHRIYSGKEKVTKAPIVISTWQSIYQLPKKFFEGFDVVYGDECHLFKAKSLSGLLQKMTNTPFKVGTTGTLDGTKTHRLVLEGLFGPVHRVTTTRELMDRKQLADLKIKCLVLKWPDAVRKNAIKLEYQDEMDFLVTNERRNQFLTNLALDQKGNTLLLFQFVEKHGKVLYEMIRERAAEKRKVFFVYGGVDATDREAVRAITEKESDAIIVASFGTFSTGVNIRNIRNVIFASPTKSRIRNLQSIGRGLRIADGKTTCTLYDIGDDMSWKSKQNTTLRHLLERIQMYNEEGFDYKLITFPIYPEPKNEPATLL